MRIVEEMRKNALTLVRSPAALVTLIIGPLLLLLLVGLALSGTTLQGITVGVTGPGASSVAINATEVTFNTVDACVLALKGQLISICLEFDKFNTSSGVPQGTVIFHVDETRQRVTEMLVSQISGELGVESSKIRVEAVQGLLDQFGQIAAFMSEKRTDLVNIRQEALSMRSDVTQRRIQAEQRLALYRDVYYPVRDRLTNTTISLGDAIDSLDPLVTYLYGLQQTTALANDTNTSILIGAQADHLASLINQSRRQVKESIALTGGLLTSLENIDGQLEDDVNATRDYEQKIDTAVASIDVSISQLDADIEKLGAMDPALAARIDKPIIQQVQTLFEDLRAIEAGFPQLFCIVIIFISTLFGTIVTLMEINSRAVLRNTLAPTSELWTVIALCITSLIVVALQGMVLLLVAQYMLHIDVAVAPAAMIGGVLSLTFICIGVAVGLRLRKEQASVLVATFAALIVLLFSDVMVPLELMPGAVASVVRYNPLVVATAMLKQSELFGTAVTFNALAPLLIALAVSFVLLGIAYRVYRTRSARW